MRANPSTTQAPPFTTQATPSTTPAAPSTPARPTPARRRSSSSFKSFSATADGAPIAPLVVQSRDVLIVNTVQDAAADAVPVALALSSGAATLSQIPANIGAVYALRTFIVSVPADATEASRSLTS